MTGHFYYQATYDFHEDRDVTVAISQAALKDLLGRITDPPEDERAEHLHGSFEHLGHVDRFVVVIPTAGDDHVSMQGTEMQVWLSADSLSSLIEGCDQDLVRVLYLEAAGVRPRVTVIGERDGFHSACILWPLLPKGHARY
jgi:hypothetical protein